jgi:uncharacterized protein (TIGR00251 family)
MRESGDSILLELQVSPGASKSQLAELREGRLRVRIAAAPADGKANAELIAFFAKSLGCAKKEIRLTSGEKSRLKTIAVPGRLREKLLLLINAAASGGKKTTDQPDRHGQE